MDKQQSIQRFGEKLHALRTMHNMTLKELANHFGFSAHSYIIALESGQKLPSVEFVVGIARLFDVTTDQLLKDELDLELQLENSREQ